MTKQQFDRTDLLVEHEEMVQHQSAKEKQTLQASEGVQFNEKRVGRIIVTTVEMDKEAEQRIGKKAGTYTTLAFPTLTPTDEEGMQELANMFYSTLHQYRQKLQIAPNASIVIVGLGNREVTPDAVGPATMDRLTQVVPDYFSENRPELYVFAPGVTIQTGLETAEFLEAIVKKIKPDLLIVIDALAARDSSRLCRTIQMTDTGIHPGSGVGNNRKEVSKETMGVPVLAIGIPTIVDGIVYIADAVEKMMTFIASKIEEEKHPSSKLSVTNWLYEENPDADRTPLRPIFGDWSSWSKEERVQLFQEVYAQRTTNAFIAPKEIDAWIHGYAEMFAQQIADWLKELKSSH